MAVIDELVSQIENPELRARIAAEVGRMAKQKKFGLVFEEHLPECTPLWDTGGDAEKDTNGRHLLPTGATGEVVPTASERSPYKGKTILPHYTLILQWNGIQKEISR